MLKGRLFGSYAVAALAFALAAAPVAAQTPTAAPAPPAAPTAPPAGATGTAPAVTVTTPPQAGVTVAPTASPVRPAANAQRRAARPPSGNLSLPEMKLSMGGAKGKGDTAIPLQLVALLTVLSVAPAILMMMTSFTRIVIVLGLTRQALGTQQIPPNQVLMGLALCLTFFTMQPTLAQMNDRALQPYLGGRITFDEAAKQSALPLRAFMLRQTRESDLGLFVELSRTPTPRTVSDVPTYVIIPAFIISELKTAFTMGFVIFLPFLVVDLVVSMILMSMGMVMLPPMLISLPFKILLFIMVDGWHLLARALSLSFQ
jgi:flagellar biosynthetic protein FliP